MKIQKVKNIFKIQWKGLTYELTHIAEVKKEKTEKETFKGIVAEIAQKLWKTLDSRNHQIQRRTKITIHCYIE